MQDTLNARVSHSRRLLGGLLVLGLLAAGGCAVVSSGPDAPAAGADSPVPSPPTWRPLFDGESFHGWRGFRQESVPSCWQIEEGVIGWVADEERGDLTTEDQFTNFELAIEWRISPGGNSGIFFHVTEEHDRSWQTGPELQVLDDDGHRDGEKAETSAGSNYALHPPTEDMVRPVGEWNDVRVLVDGQHVEQWLNGTKIVEYELGSEDWEARVAASKFASMPDYGRAGKGHIVLQDHGDEVWFRNIRIRELP